MKLEFGYGTGIQTVDVPEKNPQPDAQTAFDEAMARYGEDATVIAMPFGGATLPMPPA